MVKFLKPICNFWKGVWAELNGDVLLDYEGTLYPMDRWPGYDNCQRLGCCHYRCEHGVLSDGEVVYSTDPNLPVGTKTEAYTHCDNAGCHCPEFMDAKGLSEFVQAHTLAQLDSYQRILDLPGVTEVEAEVLVHVSINTIFNDRENYHEHKKKLYELEKYLMEIHPNVCFDFNSFWRPAKEEE